SLATRLKESDADDGGHDHPYTSGHSVQWDNLGPILRTFGSWNCCRCDAVASLAGISRRFRDRGRGDVLFGQRGHRTVDHSDLKLGIGRSPNHRLDGNWQFALAIVPR